MKRLWTVLLVAFMLCIGFSTVTHATDTNLNTPAYDTPAFDMVDFPTMQDSSVSGYTALPDKIGALTVENKLYSYGVLPSAYSDGRIRLRCCNSNFYQKINGKAFKDAAGLGYSVYTKSKTINLRT